MWLVGIRDIAIVLLAIESLVIGILLLVTLVQIRALLRMIRDEIAPMLRSANETVSTVKGTTSFVSEHLVTPLVQASSYTTGVLQTLRSLFAIQRTLGTRRDEER